MKWLTNIQWAAEDVQKQMAAVGLNQTLLKQDEIVHLLATTWLVVSNQANLQQHSMFPKTSNFSVHIKTGILMADSNTFFQ